MPGPSPQASSLTVSVLFSVLPVSPEAFSFAFSRLPTSNWTDSGLGSQGAAILMWFPYEASDLPGSWAAISAPPTCDEVHIVKSVPSWWHSAPGLEKCVLLTVAALQSWQNHGACIFDRCLETPRHKGKTETTRLPPNINNLNSRSLVEE